MARRYWVGQAWRDWGWAGGSGDGCRGPLQGPSVLRPSLPPHRLQHRSVFSICEVFSWCSTATVAPQCIVGSCSLNADSCMLRSGIWTDWSGTWFNRLLLWVQSCDTTGCFFKALPTGQNIVLDKSYTKQTQTDINSRTLQAAVIV